MAFIAETDTEARMRLANNALGHPAIERIMYISMQQAVTQNLVFSVSFQFLAIMVFI